MEDTIKNLVAWRRAEVVERIGEWQSRGLKVVDVPVLITCLDGMPTVDLLELMGAEESRCAVAAYLLSNDPSYRCREVGVSELWEEQPFPRYLISLLYLAMMDGAASGWHCLVDELWRNVTTTNQPFGPELLRDLLKDILPRGELLNRVVELAASGVPNSDFISGNLFYSMQYSKAEIRTVVGTLLAGAADESRRGGLRAVVKRYG